MRVVPPFPGWAIPQGWPNSSVAPYIKGNSYENLIEQIVDYRIANDEPIGQPEKDIEDFFALAHPNTRLLKPVPRESAKPKTLRERVTSWAANRYQQGFTLVSQETAEARAKICASCPQNVEWSDNCAPCMANARRQILIINQGNTVAENLGACNVCGHANMAAVWLPDEGLTRSKLFKDETPALCWLRE